MKDEQKTKGAEEAMEVAEASREARRFVCAPQRR